MLSHERRAPVMVLQSRPSTANKCPTSSAACHTQGGNTSQATRTRHLHRSGSRIHACMALRPPRRPRSWQHHLRTMQLMAPSIAGASVGPPPTCSTCRAAPIALKYLGCTLRRRTAARARPSCKLQACTCASGTIGRASQVRSCAVCEWLGRGDIGSLPRSSGSVVRVVPKSGSAIQRARFRRSGILLALAAFSVGVVVEFPSGDFSSVMSCSVRIRSP